jgi:3'(2'), 5'-bisphosphate nucleotidase
VSFARELEVGERLAREAGALVVQIRAGGAWKVEMKPGDEPVTIADRQASELVVRGLRAAFPDDVIISEESDDDLARLAADRVWYVDPIDGTKDFIAGRAGFAVMIGLTVAAQPVVGVVYQPIGDNLFRASGTEGWFDAPGQPPRRLAVSDVRDSSKSRLVASASNRTAAIDAVKNALGIADELNIGSVGLKLALIALGERDLYVNPSAKCKLWDVCAPDVILRSAGGLLTDAHGAPVRYDLADLACRSGLVASNGHIHADVLAKLAHLFPRTAP